MRNLRDFIAILFHTNYPKYRYVYDSKVVGKAAELFSLPGG